ncbi:LacI family transcriptional regulator, partial [Amaricoccus sp. HAR-UPW-R2A-40]
MKTQTDIARAAGVSLKTVSRVVNGDPLVKPETRDRIERIFREMNYQPSVAARLMRAKKSDIVGFLADGVATSGASSDLIRGAQDEAWTLGKQMMLFNIREGEASETNAEAQLVQFRAEAVIFAAIAHRAVRPLEGATPRILLNCYDPEGRATAFVPDDEGMCRDLMAQVFARGYRRPYFLNLSYDHEAAHLRRAGFVKAGAEAGLDLSDRVRPVIEKTPTGHSFHVERHMAEILTLPDRPDILICGQDIIAMEVYFALARAGLAVGRGLGQAHGEDEDLHLGEELAHAGQMVTALRDHLL